MHRLLGTIGRDYGLGLEDIIIKQAKDIPIIDAMISNISKTRPLTNRSYSIKMIETKLIIIIQISFNLDFNKKSNNGKILPIKKLGATPKMNVVTTLDPIDDGLMKYLIDTIPTKPIIISIAKYILRVISSVL